MRDVDPSLDIRVVPMADGGEGTVEAFLASGALARTARVLGPLGDTVDARFAREGTVAVLEMAAASGLELVSPARRDVLAATTYGTGQLILAALDDGAARIVLGIGGSATNDGGAGALAALGVRFLDRFGLALDATPARLADVAAIDVSGLDPRLASVDLEIACDVDNPLLGANGATSIYGPQKGATGAIAERAERGLRALADAVAASTGRDLRDLPGAGAAGGLGFGLASLAGARLRRGVDVVGDVRGLDAALRRAAYCITGEGRIDVQTLHGKTVAGVAERARAFGVPVFAIGGSIDRTAEPALFERGIVCVPICATPMSLEEAMAGVLALVRDAAARIARSRPVLSDPTGGT